MVSEQTLCTARPHFLINFVENLCCVILGPFLEDSPQEKSFCAETIEILIREEIDSTTFRGAIIRQVISECRVRVLPLLFVFVFRNSVPVPKFTSFSINFEFLNFQRIREFRFRRFEFRSSEFR